MYQEDHLWLGNLFMTLAEVCAMTLFGTTYSVTKQHKRNNKCFDLEVFPQLESLVCPVWSAGISNKRVKTNTIGNYAGDMQSKRFRLTRNGI